MEQAKAQEFTLKKAIEGPAASVTASDEQGTEKERACKALVKAGEIPAPIPSPTSTEVQGPRKAPKAIKAPILLCVFHSALIA